MLTRLAIWLHDRRRGHQVYDPMRYGLLGCRRYCSCGRRWFL